MIAAIESERPSIGLWRTAQPAHVTRAPAGVWNWNTARLPSGVPLPAHVASGLTSDDYAATEGVHERSAPPSD